LLRDDLRHCCARRPEDRLAGSAQLAHCLRQYDQRRRELAERLAAERKARQRHRLAQVATIAATLLAALALALGYGLQEASRQRRLAEAHLETARAHLYAANVNLAFHAFRENNLGTALDLLVRHQPVAGQRDLRDWEWRYLRGQCRSGEICTLGFHSSFVVAVAFSPDGKQLASSGRDGVLKIWDLDQRRLATTLEHNGRQMAFGFSPDGRHLATGIRDGGGGIRLWDTQTWQLTADFGQATAVQTLVFAPDGRTLATADEAQGVWWDLARHEPIAPFQSRKGTDFGAGLGFSPDGEWLASAVGPVVELTRCRDLTAVPESANLKGHRGDITAVAFSPDGTWLAAGGWDKSVRVWQVADRAPVVTLTNHTAWVSSVAFSPDGEILATAGADQRIGLWRTRDWEEVGVLKGHLHEVWAMAVSPDGRHISTGGKDESVRLWDLAPPPARSSIHPRPEAAVHFFPEPQGLFAGLFEDGSVVFFDPTSGLERRRIASPFAPSEIMGGAVAPGEGLVAMSLTNCTVALWDPVSREVKRRLGPTPETIERPFFSPSGDRLAGVTQSADLIYVWSVSDGRVVQVLANDLGRLSGLVWPTFSPDARRLATGHMNGDACLWAVDRTGGHLRLEGHKSAVFALAFSPTGRRVAAGTGDGWIKLWDVETAQEVATIAGPPGFIGFLAFPREADTLVAAGAGGLQVLTAPSFSTIDPSALRSVSDRHPAPGGAPRPRSNRGQGP